MLMPKRTKFRKVQRGRMKGAASRGNKVSYGEFGIQAMEPGWITGNQIEAARIAMTRYTKRSGQVWIKIFPDKPVSKKALGVRMGSGKARCAAFLWSGSPNLSLPFSQLPTLFPGALPVLLTALLSPDHYSDDTPHPWHLPEISHNQ